MHLVCTSIGDQLPITSQLSYSFALCYFSFHTPCRCSVCRRCLLFYHHCIRQLTTRCFEEIIPMQVTLHSIDTTSEINNPGASKSRQERKILTGQGNYSKILRLPASQLLRRLFFKFLRLFARWRISLSKSLFGSFWLFGLTESAIEIDLLGNTQADPGAQETRRERQLSK